MVIAPTENHLQHLKRLMTKMISMPLQDFRNITWQTAPALCHGTDTSMVLLKTVDVVAIDDADYPNGFKWSMKDVVKMVHTSRRPLLILTCRHAGILAKNLSIAIPSDCQRTFATSFRLEAINHAEFVKSLFTPKNQQLGLKLPKDKLPFLIPKSTMPEMALAALHAVHSLYTVILCENEEILQTVFRLAPTWNEERQQAYKSIIPVMKLPTNTNQYFDPCSLQLSTIANFFGQERRHVVVVFSNHLFPTKLFVEGITRHTKSLTIVFPTTSPPPPLENVLWMTTVAEDHDVYIDSAPKRARPEPPLSQPIGSLAQSIVDDTRDLERAFERMLTLTSKSVSSCSSTFIPNYATYTGPPLPANIDRALGSVVEAVVLAAIGAQQFCDAEVYRKVAATNPSWLLQSDQQLTEEDIWRLTTTAAQMAGQTDVCLTEDFYDYIRQTGYRYFGDIHTASGTYFANITNITPQVPLTLSTTDKNNYHGNTDALVHLDPFGSFILEIKHSLKHLRVSDYAVVQATLYAIAAGASKACAFNAASGNVVQIDIS
jgi:hypothetical protein